MYWMHVEKSQQIIKRKQAHTSSTAHKGVVVHLVVGNEDAGTGGGFGLGADRGPSDGGRIGRMGIARAHTPTHTHAGTETETPKGGRGRKKKRKSLAFSERLLVHPPLPREPALPMHRRSPSQPWLQSRIKMRANTCTGLSDRPRDAIRS